MFLYLADNNENAGFRAQDVVPRRFRGTLPACRMLRLAMKDCHHTLTRDSRTVLRDLLASEGYVVITVDTAWIQGDKEGRLKDIVFCESPSNNVYPGQRRSPITRVTVSGGSTGRRR